MSNKIPYKIYLSEEELPTHWYNLRADMKNKPAPLRNPKTLEVMGYEDLRPVFCDELIKQELDGHGVKYTASQVKYIGACVSNEYFTERNFAS